MSLLPLRTAHRPVCLGDVAGDHERSADLLGQLAHVLLDAIALVGEPELGTAVGECLADAPRDRARIGDAENDALLAFE